MKLKIITIFVFIVMAVFVFNAVFAADYSFDPQYPWEKENIKELGGSGGLVAKIYLYALAIAGVLAFGILVYGGVLWSISGAVSTQAEAKEWITAAVSGLILLLCAYAILYIINPEITKLNISKLEKVEVKKTAYSQNADIVNYSDSECRNNGCTIIRTEGQNQCICPKSAESGSTRNDCVTYPDICGSAFKCDAIKRTCVPKE